MKVELKTIVIVLSIVLGAICASFGASKLFGQKNSNVEEYVYSSRMNSSTREDIITNYKTSEEQASTVVENAVDNKYEENTNVESIGDNNNSNETINEEVTETTVETKEEVIEVVYNGMTLDDVSSQLNRSLNSTLSGQGNLIASYSLEKGVDPYLATAIMLHETGCNWNCSSLVTSCNNVGGMKGGPTCGNTSYKAFATLEDGIKGFIDNLAVNYYAYGLTTPELMNSRYAESTTWATKVNTYINKIKSN